MGFKIFNRSSILIVNNQSPILIGNIKAKVQFLLAISKPNSYWQHRSPIIIGNNQSLIFINTTLSKKRKEPKIIKAWQKKKKNIMLPKQERLIASIYEETQKNVFTN